MFKILRDLLRNLLNFKVILGAIIFALGVFAVLVFVLWSAKAKSITPVPATAILHIIEAATETPIAPIASQTPVVTPTSSQPEPPPSSNIAIGDYVQVSGTGGDGLRLHKEAGVSSEVRYIALESEVFLVKDGPIDMDGYIWWLLQDPYTDNAAGWGVGNYLAIVQNP
jgi:hypothetical protein